MKRKKKKKEEKRIVAPHPMLLSASPCRQDRNLGRAYNEFFELLPDGAWGCLVDHDAMFTIPDWQRIMLNAIERNPDFWMFTGTTNRVGCSRYQRARGTRPQHHDMMFHARLGRELRDRHRSEVVDITDPGEVGSKYYMAGFLMLLSKKAWSEVGGFKHGFLTVDNDMHRRVGEAGGRVGLLKGVYLYHFYRALGRGK